MTPCTFLATNDKYSSQIGRTAWLKGADGQCRYPDLRKLREVDSPAEAGIDLHKAFRPSEAKGDFHARPLEGTGRLSAF